MIAIEQDEELKLMQKFSWFVVVVAAVCLSGSIWVISQLVER